MKKIILPVRFGLVTSAVLIAYFLFLALFNKQINPIFSFLNAGITIFGIFEAIRFYKLEQGDAFTYTNGFSAGIITGATATIIFTVFFLFYSTEINPDFLAQLLENMHGFFKINDGLVTFIVAIMGFATTVVGTLTVMQLFKNSGSKSQKK